MQPGELAPGGGIDLLAGQQRHHVVGVRVRRVQVGGDPALPQHHDAIGEPEHLVDVVAGEQDRCALLAQPQDQLLDLSRLLHAERGGGFVKHQQPRPASHGAGHRDHLPLPAGQRPYAAGGVLEGDVEARQELGGRGVEARVGHHQPPRFAAEHDVGRDVQVVAQGQVLPDDRDAVLGRPARIIRQPPPGEEDLAVHRDHVAGDTADQGGLARAVLSRQGDEFAGLQAQVDAVQGAHRAVAQAQPRDCQQRRVACSLARVFAGVRVAAYGHVAAGRLDRRAQTSRSPTREPVMPSLCGLNRALGHKSSWTGRSDQAFSCFLNVAVTGAPRSGWRLGLRCRSGGPAVRSLDRRRPGLVASDRVARRLGGVQAAGGRLSSG